MAGRDAHLVQTLLDELTAWLGSRPSLGGALRKLSGGVSGECYAFELADAPVGIPARLVLRLMREDRAAVRECAVQSAAEAAGIPVPHIFRAGTCASAFARPFSIMAFVEGRDPVGDGSIRRVPDILASVMDQLHALPTASIRASIGASGIDVRQLEASAVIDVLRGCDQPEIARAAHWFAGDFFDAAGAVLCHGDLHPRNLLMHHGRVAAVLDWEIAVFAPRAYDVARTELLLLLMPGVGATPIRPLVRLLGKRASRQFIAAYTARATIDQETLNRCRALHVLRLVALVRSHGSAADGVRKLWRPFEKELSRRWFGLTGTAL